MGDNKTFSERIRQVIEYSHLTDNAFAKKIKASQSGLSSMFKRGTNPSAKVIYNILQTFPEISAEWLLRGRGNMFDEAEKITKSTHNAAKPGGAPDIGESTPHTPPSPDSQLTTLLKMIDSKDSTIRRQAEEIGTLKERLSTIQADKGENASGATSPQFVDAG